MRICIEQYYYHFALWINNVCWLVHDGFHGGFSTQKAILDGENSKEMKVGDK
jgi:hypothetical protein